VRQLYKVVARGRQKLAPVLIKKWFSLQSEDGSTMNVTALFLEGRLRHLWIEKNQDVKVYSDEQAERKYAELFPDEA
jgi:hypothetical protein